MHTPEAITAILHQIIELTRLNSDAYIDTGAVYAAPHMYETDFILNAVNQYQQASGISR